MTLQSEGGGKRSVFTLQEGIQETKCVKVMRGKPSNEGVRGYEREYEKSRCVLKL